MPVLKRCYERYKPQRGGRKLSLPPRLFQEHSSPIVKSREDGENTTRAGLTDRWGNDAECADENSLESGSRKGDPSNQPRTHIGIGTANGGTSLPGRISDRRLTCLEPLIP